MKRLFAPGGSGAGDSQHRVRPRFFNAGGPPGRRNRGRAPVASFQAKQTQYLNEFRRLAAAGDWPAIHHMHYDWWQFPIDDGSRSEYNVTSYEDVADLKSDPEWRVGYLESVRLCALAWGWDVDTGARVPPDQRHRTQGWSDWDVRLAKMIRSLWIFEEYDYFISLQNFAKDLLQNEKKRRGGFYYGSICLDEILYMRMEHPKNGVGNGVHKITPGAPEEPGVGKTAEQAQVEGAHGAVSGTAVAEGAGPSATPAVADTSVAEGPAPAAEVVPEVAATTDFGTRSGGGPLKSAVHLGSEGPSPSCGPPAVPALDGRTSPSGGPPTVPALDGRITVPGPPVPPGAPPLRLPGSLLPPASVPASEEEAPAAPQIHQEGAHSMECDSSPDVADAGKIGIVDEADDPDRMDVDAVGPPGGPISPPVFGGGASSPPPMAGGMGRELRPASVLRPAHQPRLSDSGEQEVRMVQSPDGTLDEVEDGEVLRENTGGFDSTEYYLPDGTLPWRAEGEVLGGGTLGRGGRSGELFSAEERIRQVREMEARRLGGSRGPKRRRMSNEEDGDGRVGGNAAHSSMGGGGRTGGGATGGGSVA